ncbi:MAG: 50S ribosomal protein L33 [Candidatus Omnitrophica bacterium]|nr:50S ribosomal protein L33 [Candidatus Omnitrophota bacterium]
MRDIIQFECTACRHRNYSSNKNKKLHPERLELKKFCPFCRSHTAHKEVK